MSNATSRIVIAAALGLALAAALPGTASAAAFVKFGDIKGESTGATAPPPAPAAGKLQGVGAPPEPQPAALLLPAVQKVRDAAAADAGKPRGASGATRR